MPKTFEEANERVHPVETQWHYEYMTKYGFKPLDQTKQGFVRAYRYEGPDGHLIVCSTGFSSDHWEDQTTGNFGYFADLEPHLKKITGAPEES